MPVARKVFLAVYDLFGRKVATRVNEVKQRGRHEVEFDGSGIASGVYFYRMQARQIDGGQAGSFVETKKLLLVR